MPWNSSQPAMALHRDRKNVGLERATFSKVCQSLDSTISSRLRMESSTLGDKLVMLFVVVVKLLLCLEFSFCEFIIIILMHINCIASKKILFVI